MNKEIVRLWDEYCIEYHAIIKNSRIYFYKLTKCVLNILSEKRKLQENNTK